MTRDLSKNVSKKNQEKLLCRVIKSVGQKYTPDLHIPLPVAEVFEGLGRTKEVFHAIKKELPELVSRRSDIDRNKIKEISEEKQKVLLKKLDGLINTLTRLPNSGITTFPLLQIETFIHDINEQCYEFQGLISEAERKDEETSGKKHDEYSSKYRTESNDLHRLLNSTYEIRKFLNSDSSKCSNNPFLLLTGEAGTGKTHLLCAIAEERLKNNFPTFLFLAEEINTQDPWKSILKEVGAAGSADDFLKDLNEFASRKKVRALIIIDAINEAPLRVLWERLIKSIKKYPWIGLILSVRNGFEEEYTTKAIRKSFVKVEHKGFTLREWEAVTKYFNQYDIPLPEIPLLLSEFSNPLFLTIFCKTHKGGKRQIKGHVGFTTIFEYYVIEQGDEVLSSFGLPVGRDAYNKHPVWDLIFKDIAIWMSKNNSERIPEQEAKSIIKKHFKNIDPKLFLTSLEKHFLLFRIPHYDSNYKVSGFDYKFPYQKFSDHLIVRYLLKEYLVGNPNPRSAFRIGTPLGKIIHERWPNYGLVEALSIQVPEWLKGRELIFLAPSKFRETETAKRAFLASLVWRKLSIKKGKSETIKPRLIVHYFNKHLIRTHAEELKNTLISTAPILSHPFNAFFLHKHLSGMKMPRRDSFWLPFLHNHYATYGEDSSIDRIIYWSWKRSELFPLSDESIKLMAIPLVWFLASSNRYLRDGSTKALVALLEKHINILTEIIDLFSLVDDPYIIERLYAAAYGCALRSQDKDSISKLALCVYEKIFSKGNPPVHILLRDYARGIVETGLITNPRLKVNKKLIQPPYSSRWPKKIPSLEHLKKTYYSKKIKNKFNKEIDAYGRIWYSLMYSNHGGLCDFGRYVVDSAVSRWADVPIKKENRPLTRKEVYKSFLADLTPLQRLNWNRYMRARQHNIKSQPIWSILRFIDMSEEKEKEEHKKELEKISTQEKRVEILRKEFVKKLNPTQKKIYEDWVGPYQNRDSNKMKDLDSQAIERLIFSTIIKLGWDPELFADFDDGVNDRGREAKKSERIGKKYQWIAFHEVLARIADNYAFKPGWSDELQDYKGVWQFWDRDLDPSVLWNEPKEKYEKGERFDFSYSNWKPSLTATEWAKIDKDLPSQSKFLQFKDKAGKTWLILKRYYTWEQPDVPGQEKYGKVRRELWYMVQGYLVPKKEADRFFKWGKKQDFMGRWMPEGLEIHQIYLREFPYHLAYRDQYNEKNEKFRWREVKKNSMNMGKTEFKVITTYEDYLSEISSFDCSTDGVLGLKLPSKEVYELLDLSSSDEDGVYKQGNEIAAFDLIVKGQASGLAIDKKKLQEALKNNDLELFWVVLGEKVILGGIGNFMGRLEIGGIHRLKDDGKIESHIYKKYLPPEKPKKHIKPQKNN